MRDDLFLPLFKRHPITFARGEGVWLYDTDGRAYLDFMAGIAVNLLGHAHPALVDAISEQAGRVLHTTNLFWTEPAIAAAEAIVSHLPGGRVFFCNSGTEANEAAIKFVRKHAWRNGETSRRQIVAVEGSFHGRTLGSLSLTIQPKKWEGFEPLPGSVVSVGFDDIDALDEAVTEQTAAVFIEPIQGEIGIRPMSDAFVHAARTLTRERGALLVADEVQTGMGRTGSWWGLDHYGVGADVVTLAKGLAGGVPMGALWARDEIADAFRPSDHGTTQGGNPLACAACAAVFATIEKDDLVNNATDVGAVLAGSLRARGYEVRGRGLLLAAELGREVASAVVAKALEHGLIVNDVNPTSVRFAPPLVATADEAREAVERFDAAVKDAT
jgi:predicted acetylornithine/succinylornithine family transaminase